MCVRARAYMSLRTFTITTTTSPISNKIVLHTFMLQVSNVQTHECFNILCPQ